MGDPSVLWPCELNTDEEDLHQQHLDDSRSVTED